MVTEITNDERASLLPERYPQYELFICDVADAVLKDIMHHMEHPFYSLSKKPETNIRRYENGGNWIEITPSVKGLATIYDKDILIYCVSQVMGKLNQGEKVSKRIRIVSHDLLKFTNRGTSGRDYMALVEAIDRLGGTRISTNIRTGDEEQYDNFGLIDSASIRRKNGLDGRLLWCEVTLSDWVFNAIKSQEVLTLHRDYFRLKKPLERRVYEIARKHCGQQKSWSVSTATLLKKSGSQSPIKRFRQMIKGLTKNDHLPDYSVRFNEGRDTVTFFNRSTLTEIHSDDYGNRPYLEASTYEKAKKAAPGYDVYELEQQWLHYWYDSGKPDLNSPDGAFINFCKYRHERSPLR